MFDDALVIAILQIIAIDIILGGDNSLSLGSIQAAKKLMPSIKTLWFDSHIDIPNKRENATLSSLQYLTGINSPTDEHQCLNLTPNDIIFIGPKQVKNSAAINFIGTEGGLLIGRYNCLYNNMEKINNTIMVGGDQGIVQET